MGALDEEQLVTRPVTDPDRVAAFRERYRRHYGVQPPAPAEDRPPPPPPPPAPPALSETDRRRTA